MSAKQRDSQNIAESLSRKKIQIPQIYTRSKEKDPKKQYKRHTQPHYEQENPSKPHPNQNVYYQTDQKRKSSFNNREAEELKQIILGCPNCTQKLSEYATKKPKHQNYAKAQGEQKAIQTHQKPFLVDLIEERVVNICRQNAKLNEIVHQKQEELIERQQQLNEIEDKFTNIIYTLSQDICFLKLKENDEMEIKENIRVNSETPSYIKGLILDRK